MNNEKWIDIARNNSEEISEIIKDYVVENLKEQNIGTELHVYIDAEDNVKSADHVYDNDNKKVLAGEYKIVYSNRDLQKYTYTSEGEFFEEWDIEGYCDWESDWDILKEYDPESYKKVVEEERDMLIAEAVMNESEFWLDKFTSVMLGEY